MRGGAARRRRPAAAAARGLVEEAGDLLQAALAEALDINSANYVAAVKAAGFKDAVHVQGGVTAWATRIDKALPTY